MAEKYHKLQPKPNKTTGHVKVTLPTICKSCHKKRQQGGDKLYQVPDCLHGGAFGGHSKHLQ